MSTRPRSTFTANPPTALTTFRACVHCSTRSTWNTSTAWSVKRFSPQVSVPRVGPLHSLPEIRLSRRCASGWIDALSCRRRYVRILRDARIEVGWLHRSAGIPLYLRNMVDTRIYLGGRNGRCTRLQGLLRGAARGWLTTAHRPGRGKSNSGNRHCQKQAQQGNRHKSKHLPGPSFGRQCTRPPAAFVW